ncbi:hypothetical protein DCAR_0519234 [Daucus carota subsp. sativus]|uniref:Uncharacterized protein n=1 Tax=Daucus carota subsp. sativus TaxID=79200 RepID=A0A161YJS1_DAUCS|nr:hypothetical protein DCAR_0519234 [Daucus carota subsp. sativus]
MLNIAVFPGKKRFLSTFYANPANQYNADPFIVVAWQSSKSSELVMVRIVLAWQSSKSSELVMVRDSGYMILLIFFTSCCPVCNPLQACVPVSSFLQSILWSNVCPFT